MEVVTKDKRAYKRYEHHAPIFFEYVNTESGYDAEMCNHSMGGMCFESDYALPTGTEIYIKMKNFSPDSSGPESRAGYRAEVRWCLELKGKGSRNFIIGVNYFDPVLLS